MRLFNVNRLSDELRADAVSEADKFRYLLVLVAEQFLRRVFNASPQHLALIQYAFIALTALMSITGLWACYKANQRGDNRDFLDRFVCLSVPMSIWYILIYLVLVDGGFYLTQKTMAIQEFRTLMLYLAPLISISSLVLYFGAMYHFLSRTAMPPNTTATPPIALP